MKKTLLFLLLLSGIANAQIVNIPDAAFKSRLLAANSGNSIAQTVSGSVSIDTNNDGEIQESEALLINNLNLEASGILSLEGIHAFSNLSALNCNSNELNTLDLGVKPNLQNLSCNGNHLSSINLQGLPQLTFLNCAYNNLLTIDVTPCPHLYELALYYNNLVAGGIVGLSTLSHLNNLGTTGNASYPLNLTGLTNLTILDFQESNQTTIDLTPVPNLQVLSCANNLLTTIDLSPVPHLNELFCQHNLLASLDVSVVPELVKLYLDYNPLSGINLAGSHVQEVSFSNLSWTSLDLSGISTIKYFGAYDTPFTDLDFSGQPQLFSLALLDSNLQTLNIKNGTTTQGMSVGLIDCTSLAFICADEVELSAIQNELDQNGYSNCSVSSYCSFTPGGNYNTINGTVRFDANSNGCDTNDIAIHNIRIGIDDGSTTGATFTNNQGNYTFFTQQSGVSFSCSLENPAYFNVTPPDSSVNFPQNSGLVETRNFCLTANGVHPDVEIIIVPMGVARPGFDSDYEVIYKNKGNQPLSGQVSFNFEDNVFDLVSTMPLADLISGGNLTFNYSDLLPFESRSIQIKLNLNSPTEIPAVNIGDALSFNATIVSNMSPDDTVSDNTFILTQAVVGSFDPNDKYCLEGDHIAPSEIGKYLHYVINFENTGTAAAENIVVKDAIDISKFDLSSLQMLSASHQVQVRVVGNRVDFIFEGINLGTNEHGHVVFKIKTKSTLAANAIVTNKADIFFDYNFPVATNTATTAFQLLGTDGFKIDNSVSVYPNPSGNWVNVKAAGILKSLELFDIQGRILETKQINEAMAKIDISKHAAGIYYLRIYTDSGVKTEKLFCK